MKSVALGHTAAVVSQYCLGTNLFGSRVPAETAFQVLDAYTEAGGSFVDTANVYACWLPGCSGGESERAIGTWMRQRRQQLFVATKVGLAYGDVPRSLRAARIQSECDKSLARLQVEAIDLYYAHVDVADCPLEETLEAFDRLITAGKVRFAGASNFSRQRLEAALSISRARGWAAVCCAQQRYSYLHPADASHLLPQIAADDAMRRFCHQRGLSLLAYSPLLQGAYARADRRLPEAYLGSANEARLAAVQEVAAEAGATPNQVVLAWLMQQQPPITPVVGTSTVPQLLENLGALSLRLETDHLSRLASTSA